MSKAPFIRVDEVTPLVGHEIDANLSEETAELYSSIRKRLPGIRCGLRKTKLQTDAVLYYAGERVVRGTFGHNKKDYESEPTYFVSSPYINKEKSWGDERHRTRSIHISTTARKAKEALKAPTLPLIAGQFSDEANRVNTTKPKARVEWDKNVSESVKELIAGPNWMHSSIGFSERFKAALDKVAFADSDIQQRVDFMLGKGEPEKVNLSPIYVAVYERYDSAVMDVYDYRARSGSASAIALKPMQAVSQHDMSDELRARLATLSMLEVGQLVEGMGVRVSEDEFIVAVTGIDSAYKLGPWGAA